MGLLTHWKIVSPANKDDNAFVQFNIHYGTSHNTNTPMFQFSLNATFEPPYVIVAPLYASF